ncbi:hypothetical protein SAMN05421688_0235 [Poseidonocella pacifica]|uniref:HdeA/HdeB family protein n=1 Tax=Poseidonocella pacifica TaxID=871651 RepID=A0A1I0V3G2_9RHOB|nr:hypothetical protein [Poseidonocella pacifica]SFA70597.1 hypothetical protein SAMN05421688_0235 [Poseidonocella pacifica]
MIRFLIPLIAATSFVPVAVAAAPDSCAIQGDIVGQARTLRRGGTDEKTTSARISAELSGAGAAFRPAVPLLVDWVFSLPEGQLAADVAEEYEATCRAETAG